MDEKTDSRCQKMSGETSLNGGLLRDTTASSNTFTCLPEQPLRSGSQDSAEHIFFECDRWFDKKRNLEIEVGYVLTPDNIVHSLKVEDRWKSKKMEIVKQLVKDVMWPEGQIEG